MQVTDIIGRGRIFVSNKGGEMAGVVVLLGRIDDICPGSSRHTGCHLLRDLTGENPG